MQKNAQIPIAVRSGISLTPSKMLENELEIENANEGVNFQFSFGETEKKHGRLTDFRLHPGTISLTSLSGLS